MDGVRRFWTLAAVVVLPATACAERGEEPAREAEAPAVDLRALQPQVMIGEPQEMAVVPGDSLVVRLTMLNGFEMTLGGGPGHLVVAVGDRMVDHYSVAEPVVVRGLSAGCHLLRAAVVDAAGRTLETPGALDYRNVCVGRRGQPVAGAGAPVLFSNAPRDTAVLAPGDSLMIDYRVSGAVLGPDNYRVRWAWDGRTGEAIGPGPVWLKEGLELGAHRFRLELVAPPGQPAGVPVIERTVTVRKP